MTSSTGDEPLDEHSFKAGLEALVERAEAAGVDLQRAWYCVGDETTWDVEFVRLADGDDGDG